MNGITLVHGMDKNLNLHDGGSKEKECILPIRNLQDGEIPSGYAACTIPQQIKYYRQHVYDGPMQDFKEDSDDFFESKAFPGLSVVLENAFALVNDYIIRDEKSSANKTQFQNELKTLWSKAKLLEGKLTSPQFQKFNLELAEIVDRYKYNLNNIEKNLTVGIKERVNNAAVFVIYGNPNPQIKRRNISPYHFVQQYCAEPYSGYVAFFDVLSMKTEKRSRKDPHWSMENGTYNMLHHDYRHISVQLNNLSFSSFERESDYETIKNNFKASFRNAYKTYEKYKILGKNNEATILIDGLFIILHEKPSLIERNADYFISNDSLGGLLTKIQQNQLNTMFRVYNMEYGTMKYKEERRDWEFILRDRYIDSQDPSIIKPVHDKDGIPFLPIRYDSNINKMTRPFADTESDKRKELMQEALDDGVQRFWGYFIYLLENAPK